MRTSAKLTVIVIAVYLLGVILAVPLLFETGNRYAWMKEVDPQTTTLPTDENALFRLSILVGGTFLCGLIGLASSGFVSRKWHKRSIQVVGALLVVLSVGKALYIL